MVTLLTIFVAPADKVQYPVEPGKGKQATQPAVALGQDL